MCFVRKTAVSYLVSCSYELDQHSVKDFHLAAQADLWWQALRMCCQL